MTPAQLAAIDQLHQQEEFNTLVWLIVGAGCLLIWIVDQWSQWRGLR